MSSKSLTPNINNFLYFFVVVDEKCIYILLGVLHFQNIIQNVIFDFVEYFISTFQWLLSDDVLVNFCVSFIISYLFVYMTLRWQVGQP